MEIFIVIDEEESISDCVASVHFSEKEAKDASDMLDKMCPGGRLTSVVKEEVKCIHPFKSICKDEKGYYCFDCKASLNPEF